MRLICIHETNESLIQENWRQCCKFNFCYFLYELHGHQLMIRNRKRNIHTFSIIILYLRHIQIAKKLKIVLLASTVVS